MKPSLSPALVVLAAIAVAVLSACTSKPPAEALRAVRTAEIRYDKTQETNRYVGTVQSRHEVDQAFRVGGKVAQRKVDVGQKVREGDVLAVLDDTDYRLAEEAARQQLVAATTQARQAESDRQRLDALKTDGSVSVSDDEKAQSGAQTSSAAAEAEARKLELARNRLKYTVLRASQSGVVTAVRFEVGQVVAEGQPVVSIANEGEPEIVVDVPEDHLAVFKTARYKASLASAPGANVRRRAARTVAAGGGADANVSRPPEARDATAAAARRDRHARRRAPGRRSAGGSDPGLGDHAEQGPAGGVGGSSRGRRTGRDRRSDQRRRCTGIATTRCSSPGRRPASSSSPRACRRWRRACASRCPARPRATPKSKQAAR